MITEADINYMVDSHLAGPRPYNVQLITRKAAQEVLSSRPLPEPKEENTMSVEARAAMIVASGVYRPGELPPMIQRRTTSTSEESYGSSSSAGGGAAVPTAIQQKKLMPQQGRNTTAHTNPVSFKL
jgi:hypothetical protein